MNTVVLLLPDVALVAGGWLLSRANAWDRRFWDGLEKLVYFLLFPSLLFLTILRAPLSPGSALPLLGATLAVIGGGIALSWLALPVLRPDPVRFASGVQCGFRFNSYVALALSQRLGGDEGLALCAVMAGIVVPTVNIAAVLALARQANNNWVSAILRNPLVLATLAGLAGNLLGLSLPEPVTATLGRLGNAALALGLLTVGAGLVLPTAAPSSRTSGAAPGARSAVAASEPPAALATPPAAPAAPDTPLALWLTAVKLLAMPAIAFGLIRHVPLAPVAQQVLLMFAAMPTASSCYILAVRMGGDGGYVARLVTVSMLAALATLPGWLTLVR